MGLCYCVRLSLVVAREGLLFVEVCRLLIAGLFCRAQALCGKWASAVTAIGLSSCGTHRWAQRHMGLSQTRDRIGSLALQGGLLTIGLLRKSLGEILAETLLCYMDSPLLSSFSCFYLLPLSLQCGLNSAYFTGLPLHSSKKTKHNRTSVLVPLLSLLWLCHEPPFWIS